MIDLDAILDKAAIRDDAVKQGLELHQKQEALQKELITITSNRAYDMQYHIQTILKNPSKYGLGEFEEILLALASRMWERAQPEAHKRMIEIQQMLSTDSDVMKKLTELQSSLEKPFQLQNDKSVTEYREQLQNLREEI